MSNITTAQEFIAQNPDALVALKAQGKSQFVRATSVTPLDPTYLFYTHLVTGGQITQNSATAIDVVSTFYRGFNGDRGAPVWTGYNLSGQTITVPNANLATDGEVWVYLEDGSYGFGSFPSIANLANRIYLACLVVAGGAIANVYQVLIERNPDNASTELLFKGGIRNKSVRCAVIPNSRTIQALAGVIQVPGINYFNDPQDPHSLTVPLSSPLTYDLITPDNQFLGTRNTLEFDSIWNPTTGNIDVVNGNNACFFYFYYCPFREGNKYVAITGTFEHGSIANGFRDRIKEAHVKPDFLGLCVPVFVLAGRVDYSNANITNRNQVVVENLDETSLGSI